MATGFRGQAYTFTFGWQPSIHRIRKNTQGKQKLEDSRNKNKTKTKVNRIEKHPSAGRSLQNSMGHVVFHELTSPPCRERTSEWLLICWTFLNFSVHFFNTAMWIFILAFPCLMTNWQILKYPPTAMFQTDFIIIFLNLKVTFPCWWPVWYWIYLVSF